MTPERPQSGSAPSEQLGRAAAVVLGLALLAPLGVLGLALANLGQPLLADQIVIFFVLPAALALGLVAGIRSGPAVRLGLALMLIASGVGIALVEVVLTLALGSAAPVPGDARSTHEIVADLRAAGDHAYPSVPGNILVDLDVSFRTEEGEVHPVTTAPAFASTVLCNEGRVITYRSDRFGFNNADSLWDGPVALVAIGDSYTHGMCVEHDDQLVSHLRARGPALNLGIRGSGPLQELAVLREFGASRRPAEVVWTYYEGNDGYDYRRERERPWLTAYLDRAYGQDLAARQAMIDPLYRVWLDSLFTAGFYDRSGGVAGPSPGDVLGGIVRLRTLRRVARVGTPFPSRESNLGDLPDVIVRARDEVESWGGRFVFVYMPAYERYATFLSSGMWDRPSLLGALADAEVDVVDLHGVFSTLGDAKRFWAHPRGHLSPEGYATAAAAIIEALDREGGAQASR